MRIRVALFALALVGCARHQGDDDGLDTYTKILVAPDPLDLTVPLGGTVTQEYRVFGVDDGGDQHDITDKCALSLASADFGDFGGTNTLTAAPHGGVTQVLAGCADQAGMAQLTINLTGNVSVGPNVPANADQLFGTATLGTDAARTPAIEYPLDQAVAPVNIPPMEVQWTAGANDLFHIHMTSSHAAIDVYTTQLQATMSLPDWTSIVGTAVGEKLGITVEGLAQATPATKFASTPVALVLSHDTIDTSAIYWWASSQGSIMSQTFGNVTAPSQVLGNCSGCHSLSRAGSRIAYSRCVGGNCNGEWVGFLRYNGQTNAWAEVVNADAETIPGTYTSFAPVGNPFATDDQSVAIVTSMSGTFGLFDPDTGTAVASNLAAVAAPGRAQTMPDWSADGTQVVFASTPHAGQSVDVSDSSIAVMSYSFTGGAHTFGTPSMVVTSPITIGGQSYSNLFFPSFSPDGKLIVFNAARDSWRNFTDAATAGQRLVVVDPSNGMPIDLTALNGPGDHDITWPHWAPGSTTDYYWIVFSSERDYGHELTRSNTAAACVANGVKQCKQIWIGAVSKAALMAGQLDPSAPPVWVPGQDLTADNISPYWTKPAGIF